MSYKNKIDQVIDDLNIEINNLRQIVAMPADNGTVRYSTADRLIQLSELATLQAQRWTLVQKLIAENGKYDG